LASVLAAVAVVWAAILVATGGFDVRILGWRMRSNSLARPLGLAIAAACVYLGAGGRVRLAPIREWGPSLGDLIARRSAWIAGALAVMAVGIGAAYSTRAAVAADAYGYVSEADLWIAGRLKQPVPLARDVPWRDPVLTFSPLGYRPAPAGEAAIVPTYSPGLPMLFAIAKVVGGQCALFLVVPVFGGVAVLATYLIGVRLGATSCGLLAALLLAASPAFLALLIEPLSDVPVTAVWALAFWCLLGRGLRASIAAGLLVSLALLIRPNLVVLAVPMGAWLAVRSDEPGFRITRASLARAGAFAIALLPGVLTIAWLNTYFYGSPFVSGYGTAGDLFAWNRIVPNLTRYFGWFIDSQSPFALVGMAALVLPLRLVWPTVRDRRVFAFIVVEVLILWIMYLSYFLFDDWAYLRYVLPSWPFLMLGTSAVVLALRRAVSTRTFLPGAAVLVVLAGGLVGWQAAFTRRVAVFNLQATDAHEVRVASLVRQHTVERSVVLAAERSGSVRYYAGRHTLRYDFLEAASLDRDVAWLASRGIRAYALLDQTEAGEFRRRFAGQHAVAALDWPALVYEPTNIQLFDFGETRTPAPDPVVIRAGAGNDVPGCIPPQALPDLHASTRQP
jgi:hypothetical protein